MSTKAKSRWADNEDDVIAEAKRKQEKEEKKRAKAEKQQKLEEASRRQQEEAEAAKAPTDDVNGTAQASTDRPMKRRRLSPGAQDNGAAKSAPAKLLQFPAPEWGPCRHVDNYEKLNHIEEGSYGWVSRAREIATGEVVALKKLKMDNSPDGFPVTGLREIQTLMESRHTNIVNLREVVMGDTMNE